MNLQAVAFDLVSYSDRAKPKTNDTPQRTTATQAVRFHHTTEERISNRLFFAWGRGEERPGPGA